MRDLTLSEAKDIILGCTVMGCGGGGSPKTGLAEVKAVFDEGFGLKLCSVDELEEGTFSGSPSLCGAVGADEGASSGSIGAANMMENLRLLEGYMGKRFSALFATELGGGNTGYAMAVAARCGLPLLDADPAGRAVPQMDHSTCCLKGVPMTPFSISTSKGDRVIVDSMSDDAVGEEICRGLAASAGGMAFVCDTLSKEAALDTLVKGTISKSVGIGEALRQAIEEGRDPADATARAGGGKVLYRGRATQKTKIVSEKGFAFGDIHLQGAGDWQGTSAVVAVKNENMSLGIDGKIVVTVPDLITLIQVPEGIPVMNPSIPLDVDIAVVCYPAPAEWRTPRGLQVFGPSYLGLDMEYVPVERLF